MPTFLQLGSVKGECQDPRHLGWIQIYTFDVFQRTQPLAAQAHARVRAMSTYSGADFVAYLDACAPILLRMSLSSASVATATIDYWPDRGGNGVQYILSDPVVTLFNISKTKSDRLSAMIWPSFAGRQAPMMCFSVRATKMESRTLLTQS
jgi:type VI protein secretion system component Hcp